MKIKRVTPESYTARLGELSKGTVFRFKNCDTPYMILSCITGDEIKAMHKQRYGVAEDMLGDIEIYDKNLYIWDENDDLDEDEYLNAGEDEELIAYVHLVDGTIQLSHRHEIVIPLTAELTVQDMRSPD